MKVLWKQENLKMIDVYQRINAIYGRMKDINQRFNKIDQTKGFNDTLTDMQEKIYLERKQGK